MYDMKEAKDSPLRPHTILLGSYIDNWRWYMRDLGVNFEKFVFTSADELVHEFAQRPLTSAGEQLFDG